MPKVTYCPCCGFDFRNKNWVKESNTLLKRYDNNTYKIIKRVIQISGDYQKNYPEDIYKFLKGISITDEKCVFEGCKTFLHNKYYHTKGLNYCKYIILNLDKNEEKIVSRLQKTIGAKSKLLEE